MSLVFLLVGFKELSGISYQVLFYLHGSFEMLYIGR